MLVTERALSFRFSTQLLVVQAHTHTGMQDHHYPTSHALLHQMSLSSVVEQDVYASEIPTCVGVYV